MRAARWAQVAAFVVIGAVVARPARTQAVPDLAAAARVLEPANTAADD